jgi:MFS transporter, DHA2 family, multidrug resistance protein
MSPIGGRLSDRYPVGFLCGIGLALLGVGMAFLASLPPNPSVANIVWRMAICGIRFELFQTPNMKAIMSSAPPHRSESASGIVATARLVGQTSGAALAALCFSLTGRSGATLALALEVGFAVLGSVMSFLRLTVSR